MNWAIVSIVLGLGLLGYAAVTIFSDDLPKFYYFMGVAFLAVGLGALL